MRFVPVCAVSLVVLTGCSSGGLLHSEADGAVETSTTGETSIADGARPDTGVARPDTSAVSDTYDPPPPVDSGECNAVANIATAVTSRTVNSAAPSALGGYVSAGTYRLTDLAFFTTTGSSFPAVSVRLTMQIGGGKIQIAQDNSTDTSTSTSTYTTSGYTATLNQTCPKFQTDTMDFTATTSQLILYYHLNEPSLTGTLRYTLTK